jgi:hypothetical protein
LTELPNQEDASLLHKPWKTSFAGESLAKEQRWRRGEKEIGPSTRAGVLMVVNRED